MKGGNKGFTLVEVLVALVVLSITAVSLLQTFTGGLRASDSARQRSYAMLLAQSKMAAVGIELPLAPGSLFGRFDDRFAWEVTVVPDTDTAPAGDTGDSGSENNVMKVTVVVSWPPGTRQNSIRLTSARLLLGGLDGITN